LIANNLSEFAIGTRKVVAHTILIYWLCEELGVDLYANDLDAAMMTPINDRVMEGFVKDNMEHLGGLQPEG